jgi:hypothetical protein
MTDLFRCSDRSGGDVVVYLHKSGQWTYESDVLRAKDESADLLSCWLADS